MSTANERAGILSDLLLLDGDASEASEPDTSGKSAIYYIIDNDQKNAYISNEKQLQNHSSTFIHKSNFQPPAFYLVHPWLTTLLLFWRS